MGHTGDTKKSIKMGREVVNGGKWEIFEMEKVA